MTDRQHVPSSVRHNFREVIRDSGVTLQVANLIFGHELGFTSKDYGHGSLSRVQAQPFLKKA